MRSTPHPIRRWPICAGTRPAVLVRPLLAMALVATLAAPLAPASVPGVRRVLDEYAGHISPAARGEIARAVMAAADESGVDPMLLLAVIERESRFRVRARGPNGGTGLMQLRTRSARHVARTLGLRLRPGALHRPRVNVRLGAAYLAEMHRTFGSWPAALAAYNWGPTRIRSRMRSGKGLPTRYASAIMARYRHLDGLHRQWMAQADFGGQDQRSGD